MLTLVICGLMLAAFVVGILLCPFIMCVYFRARNTIAKRRWETARDKWMNTLGPGRTAAHVRSEQRWEIYRAQSHALQDWQRVPLPLGRTVERVRNSVRSTLSIFASR